MQKLYPGFEWSIPNSKNQVFLTFDDGPQPEITNWVLDTLKNYSAKGTFFCVGENAEKYPDIMQRISLEGHSIGNHTYNHMNGWNSKNLEYVQNALAAGKSIHGNLFRPPYGRIKRNQAALLQARGYRIMMWSLLSCDYMRTLNRQKSLESLIANSASGQIIVFHDSQKASENIRWLLPRYLDEMKDRGFEFAAI